jgi:hypothetical protein
MFSKYQLVFLFLLLCYNGFTQKLENISFAMEGEKVKLFYTLIGDYSEQTYEVKVFTSVDGFKTPLEELMGDANRKNITPGKKEVVWDAKKEYKLYEGEITFKVVANLISNFWISAPTKGEAIKRGRHYEITWEGFNPNSLVKITLHYPNGKMEELVSSTSGKMYTWKVKSKASKEVTIKVTDVNNNNAQAKSAAFTVKRKVPVIAQLGMAAAVAGGAILYIIWPEKIEPLPFPPDPSK